MKTFSVIGVALWGIAASVQADTVKLTALQGSPGGAFKAEIQTTSGSVFGASGQSISLKTYCVETFQHFTPGTTYNVTYGLSTSSGINLTTQAAWIYSQACAGTLGPTNFSIDSINALQQRTVQAAIWYFMEGGGVTMPSVPGFGSIDSTLFQSIRNLANAAALAGGAGNMYGVRIMRLEGNFQDQLVLVPLPTAAWAGLGMMGGVLGMAYIRRRKQQA